jgi:hypothetical protein
MEISLLLSPTDIDLNGTERFGKLIHTLHPFPISGDKISRCHPPRIVMFLVIFHFYVQPSPGCVREISKLISGCV